MAKRFAITPSWINYLWSFKTKKFLLDIQLVRFPEGNWFDYHYQDRRQEECCQVQLLTITLFQVTLNIEWYFPCS